MPFKSSSAKKRYNKKYHRKKLGVRGSYNTLGNLTYPSYLDSPDPNSLKNTFSIGRKRVREFKGILPRQYPASKGYKIWINRVEGRGVDVKIWKNGKMHTVMELTNYKQTSYLSPETAERYKKSLKRYRKAKKILIISYPKNISEKLRKDFQKNDIEIQEMGYQA